MSKPRNGIQTWVSAILLLTTISLIITSCSQEESTIQAASLMEGVKARTIAGKAENQTFISHSANLSVNLFKESFSESANGNTLVSPLSVLLALSMTANGADTTTLSQMEELLGGDIPLAELNEYLHAYSDKLTGGKEKTLKIANSIWLRDDEEALQVEKDFLQTNADYYRADIYKSDFSKQTVNDINQWVSRHTDGMIDQIVKELDNSAVMYLVNAIAFDAEWQTPYLKSAIRKDVFTAWDGSQNNAELMHSMEHLYVEEAQATGFIKTYTGGKYSFLALLPNDGVSIGEYIESMSGESLLETLRDVSSENVRAALPKFEYDFELKMNDALQRLGMTDAFSVDHADFSRLGRSGMGNIYIGRVQHKTFISVDELGTKAGAATSVEMLAGSASPVQEIKTVRLDRPFVYAILDQSTNLPVFIGAVMDLSK